MQNALSIDSGDDTVQDAAEGVRQSFAELVERHSRLVFRIALAITRSAQDAEDVAQETFLQLFRGGRWDQVEDQQAYLARAAWRLAVRRRKPRAQEQELDLQTPSADASPEQSAMDAQLEAW